MTVSKKYGFLAWLEEKGVISRLKAPAFWLTILIGFTFLIRVYRLDFPSILVFDEAHYVPAAQSLLEGGEDLNWVHPPLGKYFMALGILIFGDNAFGWRIMGVVLGTIAVPLLYFMVKRIFGSHLVAYVAAVLFSLDLVMFVHSRIAMLDIYLMFFVFLGFFLLAYERYLFSAIAFGLASACKVVGIFGIPAAILFLLFTKRRKSWKSIIWYLILPPIVFVIVASPLILQQGWDRWFFLQQSALSWHVGLADPHPYASRPEVWFLNGGHMLYYLEGNDVIWLRGNLIVWPLTLPSVAYITYRYVKYRERGDFFILLWFLGLYLPFFILPRPMQFLFYMVPAVPVICLLVSRAWASFMERREYVVMYPIFVLIIFLFRYSSLT